ncbi:hypothetical protein DAPPUDRAFT_118580 [Daphnia pulex]|uniref:Uncharacterized protein n=1 Tax=Daphnia pulex TaxID=6669 RepID=E9HW28_DAPPU|nr:hypothetical protein DAPPUDRAFT_118580 [Daphnia pulex]|eukprot:EFX64059.1 hypothetical protein DAPPUDRAFT_118580 [Daphnia pulex]
MTLASTNAKEKSIARATATKNPPPVIEKAAQKSKGDSTATATGTQAGVTASKTAVTNAGAKMFFVLLIIGASSQTTGGNNITVCDCGRAEVIGLMDINLPSYCDDNITSTQSVMEAYEFYVTEEPHTVWKKRKT